MRYRIVGDLGFTDSLIPTYYLRIPTPSHFKSYASFNMVSATPFSSENAFQAPNKWTPRHLQGLNIEEHHHLPASAIIEDAYLPEDDDPLFVTLAGDFAKPTRDEVLTHLTHPGNKCEMILSELDSAWECFQSGYVPQAELYPSHVASRILSTAQLP